MEQYSEKDFPDALFRKKLEDHEEQVREEVWNRLTGQLYAERKSVWRDRRTHAAAAAVFVLLGGGLWLGDSLETNEPQIAGQVDRIGLEVVAPPLSSEASIPDHSAGQPIVPQEISANEVMNAKEESSPQHRDKERSFALQRDALERTISPEEGGGSEETSETRKEVSATRVLVVYVTPPLFDRSEPAPEDAANTPEPALSVAGDELPKERKRKGINRFFKQLKNAKTGEKIDWDELGINPQRVLANVEMASPQP